MTTFILNVFINPTTYGPKSIMVRSIRIKPLRSISIFAKTRLDRALCALFCTGLPAADAAYPGVVCLLRAAHGPVDASPISVLGMKPLNRPKLPGEATQFQRLMP